MASVPTSPFQQHLSEKGVVVLPVTLIGSPFLAQKQGRGQRTYLCFSVLGEAAQGRLGKTWPWWESVDGNICGMVVLMSHHICQYRDLNCPLHPHTLHQLSQKGWSQHPAWHRDVGFSGQREGGREGGGRASTLEGVGWDLPLISSLRPSGRGVGKKKSLFLFCSRQLYLGLDFHTNGRGIH